MSRASHSATSRVLAPERTPEDGGLAHSPLGANGDQRRRILGAVQEIVAERGYAAATIMEIIARAGISSKTFYKHFSDKQDAFRSLVSIAAEDAMVHIQDSTDEKASWPARVYASLETLIALIAEKPHLARLCIVEIQGAGPEALADYQRWLRQYAASLAPRAGEPNARMPPRPGVADQIAGAISQLLYDTVRDGKVNEMPRLLPELVEIALAPYIGPRRAATFVAKRIAQLPTQR